MLSDTKASNIKNNFVYFVGQTDLYRINFNKSQRSEIDTKTEHSSGTVMIEKSM